MRSLNLTSMHFFSSPLLQILKKSSSLFVLLGVSFLFFDLQYLVMTRLPGALDNMCVMGVHRNPDNIAFAILLSLLFGWFVIGFSELIKKRIFAVQAFSFSSISAILGTLTVFCPACSFSALSIFGISIGFSVFTDYNLEFKIISLLLMSLSLILLHRQLLAQCTACHFDRS